MSYLTALAEQGFLPDSLIRLGIQMRLRAALRNAKRARDTGIEANFRREAAEGPIAFATAAANEQHYELPAAFFERVLGPRRKYSCCLYETGEESLAEAEEAMLRLTCERAGIGDGMRILDLGCGWGALSLWMAEQYPTSSVVAVSNSRMQRGYIEREAAVREIKNLEVITADINNFRPEGRFDRIVSVEMLEHVRNHKLLFQRIATWLKEDGRFFVHIFCHDRHAYPYETEGDANWMGRYFFTGGMMPSFDLLSGYNEDLSVVSEWKVNGKHYERTCHQWLARLDGRRDDVMPIMESVYGTEQANVWFGRWRLFFLACAELFAYRKGEEWYVAHYLFIPAGTTPGARHTKSKSNTARLRLPQQI